MTIYWKMRNCFDVGILILITWIKTRKHKWNQLIIVTVLFVVTHQLKSGQMIRSRFDQIFQPPKQSHKSCGWETLFVLNFLNVAPLNWFSVGSVSWVTWRLPLNHVRFSQTTTHLFWKEKCLIYQTQKNRRWSTVKQKMIK